MFYYEKDSKNLSIDLTLFQVSRATPTTSMLFDILSVVEEGIEKIWAGSIYSNLYSSTHQMAPMVNKVADINKAVRQCMLSHFIQ